MAAAGAILVRTLKLLEGKIRQGVTTADLDAAAEKFIRSQGATPGVQGLPRLPGLDLRLAELDGRARHPGPVPPRARRHHLDRRRRRPRRLGRRRRADVRRSARSSPVAEKLLDTTEASLFDAVEQCRAGNRLGDVSHAVQERVEAEGLSVVRSLVGHGIGR